jgi:hypothetical protein
MIRLLAVILGAFVLLASIVAEVILHAVMVGVDALVVLVWREECWD